MLLDGLGEVGDNRLIWEKKESVVYLYRSFFRTMVRRIAFSDYFIPNRPVEIGHGI